MGRRPTLNPCRLSQLQMMLLDTAYNHGWVSPQLALETVFRIRPKHKFHEMWQYKADKTVISARATIINSLKALLRRSFVKFDSASRYYYLTDDGKSAYLALKRVGRIPHTYKPRRVATISSVTRVPRPSAGA